MKTPTREAVLEKIKAAGHWRVMFHPPAEPREALSLTAAKALLSSSAVDLTGWDYPHVPMLDNDRQQMIRSVGSEFIEGVTDFQKYKEIVRLYRCGLFYHVVAFWEDWLAEESWLPDGHQLKRLQPGTVLDFLSVNRMVTEVFLFLRNLVLGGLYSDGVVVTTELRGVRNRALATLDPGRMPLRESYFCLTERLRLGPKPFSREEVRETHLDLAAQEILSIYRAFNWDAISLEAIGGNQEALLRRR